MGNYLVCFWLRAFSETREVLHLMGKEGSEHKCSEPPKVGILEIKARSFRH